MKQTVGVFTILLILWCAVCATAWSEPANPHAIPDPPLIKIPFVFPGLRMENTPVVHEGRPLLIQNLRPVKGKARNFYLFIEDMHTGEEVSRFGETFSFVSAFVDGGTLNVFATENTDDDWTHDIYRFRSNDLEHWDKQVAVTRKSDEHLFNASVCRDESEYVMAFESNQPVQWSFRFARSSDLGAWKEIEGINFSDVAEQTACACPTIRFFSPYYYVLYGGWRWAGPGLWYEYRLPETKYVTFLARSKDLAMWELAPTTHPMLDPIAGEGINNKDADLFEWEGNTYVYYATGDQQTWGTIRLAMYAGPMKQFLEQYFPESVPKITFDARLGKYTYPER